MQNPSHTSEEIATVIMSRAGLRTPPFAVDMAPVVCPDCGGDGTAEDIVGGWDFPIWKTHKCKTCHGVGEVQPMCEACSDKPATTLINCGCPSMSKFCDECAVDGLSPSDGIDYVVNFALAVLP